MVKFLGFLCGLCCAAVVVPSFANVATTAGNNLTAYSGTGATNNNQWNTMMNARTNALSSGNVAANFGNCNAAILRCASPKCASGGCTEMSVARPIVAGCVNANSSCKKHGDDLIDYITAQIVAQSTAKVREQEQAVAIAQAQAEAAANAAQADAQASAQMQQMQYQMQQMQSQMAESMDAMRQQMAAQSESQNAQIQSALQQRQNSYSAPAATVTTETTDAMGLEGLSVAEQLAIKNGMSADLLVREQMTGQIETAIDDAMVQMKKLKATLDEVLEYAGCDSAANMCTGPRRVKKFKELVNNFFDPYEGVLDSVYDSLILASSLGVNVNDTVMLLSGSCNLWGKYNCETCKKDADGNTPDGCECVTSGTGNAKEKCYWRVATDKNGKVASTQPHCRLVQVLKDGEEVLREWIDGSTGMMGATQVACASDVVENLGLLRGRRKETSIGIDALRNLIAQDSSIGACGVKGSDGSYEYSACKIEKCVVDPNKSDDYWEVLETAVQTKILPTKGTAKKNWCGQKPYSEMTAEDAADVSDDSGCRYFSPAFVLCSVHSHNIGFKDGDKPSNPSESEKIADMNEVIAYKSTVIAQQLKKQYDALNSVIKRFKTQLEKAILTSKMELVTGSSSSSSGYVGSSSNGNNTGLARAQDCAFETYEKVYDCLASNMRLIQQEADNDLNRARKQLEKDIEVMDAEGLCDDKNTEKVEMCTCNSTVSKNDVKKCAAAFYRKASKAQDDNEINRRRGLYGIK